MNFRRLPNRLAELERGQFANYKVSEDQTNQKSSDRRRDGAERDVKEDVEAAELLAQAMKIKHHRVAPSVRRLAEFFDYAFGLGKTAAFDQHEIPWRGDVAEKFCRFGGRADRAAILQTCFFRRPRDDGAVVADRDQSIDPELSRRFPNLSMAAFRFAAELAHFAENSDPFSFRASSSTSVRKAAVIESGLAL